MSSAIMKCMRSALCENIRLVVSTIVVYLLCAVVFAGVALGYSILPAPPAVNFVLMFGCLIMLAYVEMLHYSVVAVEKWDMTELAANFPRAAKCHALVDTPEKVMPLANRLPPRLLIPSSPSSLSGQEVPRRTPVLRHLRRVPSRRDHHLPRYDLTGSTSLEPHSLSSLLTCLPIQPT
jgi:hypothetical protein